MESSQRVIRHCGRGEAIHLSAKKENGLRRRFAPCNDGVLTCSPDERSDIRGGMRVVPDIAALIRATKLDTTSRCAMPLPAIHAAAMRRARCPWCANLLQCLKSSGIKKTPGT